MADDNAEQAAREILDRAKAVRNPLPRGVWVLGLAVGMAGLIFAIVALTRTPSAPTPHPASTSDSRSGFGLGIGIGLGAGIVVGLVVGLAIARGRKA